MTGCHDDLFAMDRNVTKLIRLSTFKPGVNSHFHLKVNYICGPL